MECKCENLHNQTVFDNTKYYHKRPRTHTFDIECTRENLNNPIVLDNP
jgi:hypothetical protein